jgi:hypothetical protein
MFSSLIMKKVNRCSENILNNFIMSLKKWQQSLPVSSVNGWWIYVKNWRKFDEQTFDIVQTMHVTLLLDTLQYGFHFPSESKHTFKKIIIILLLYWEHIVTFTTVLAMYLSWIHTLHHSPPPHPYSWNSFNRSHVSIFIYEYIVFPPHSLSFTLSLYLPHPHWYQSQDRTCFTLLFFVFEKQCHFCLFKIALQGVSLWHFHEYTYYNTLWFIPSIFFLF